MKDNKLIRISIQISTLWSVRQSVYNRPINLQSKKSIQSKKSPIPIALLLRSTCAPVGIALCCILLFIGWRKIMKGKRTAVRFPRPDRVEAACHSRCVYFPTMFSLKLTCFNWHRFVFFHWLHFAESRKKSKEKYFSLKNFHVNLLIQKGILKLTT